MILLARYWKEAAVAGFVLVLFAALGFRTVQLGNARSEIFTLTDSVRVLEAEKKAAIVEAGKARKLYKETLDSIPDQINKVKKEAEQNAYANFKKRFPTGLCGAGIGGLHMPGAATAGSGEAVSNSGNDEAIGKPVATGEPEAAEVKFVKACANDAGMLTVWQTWATKNGLPIAPEK